MASAHSAPLRAFGPAGLRTFTARRARTLVLSLLTLGAAAACSADRPTEPVAPPATTPPPAQNPTPPPPPPLFGALMVDLLDVPAGATARVTVRGGGVERVLQQSGRLDSLPPADYELSADPLVAGGITWSGDPATQTVTVRANQTAPAATIRFRATGASIALAGTGLPSYARGTIRITGDGVDRTALTRDTVRGLPAGTYTLTATDVETTDGRFTAVPPSRTVTLAAGEAASATFAYTEARGTLQITVAGLPGGAQAGIRVSGPNGFADTVHATRTIAGLDPGLYRATAGRVSSGGFSWDPDAATRDAVFTAGAQQRTLAFTYTLATGAIAVSVTGLPTGAAAALTVTGPGGYSRSVTGTETLVDLAPGTYRLTAATVTSGGVTYTASPLTRDIVVTPSLTASAAAFAYEGAFGALRVAVAGLAAGTDAGITVTGPAGFSQAVTATDTLTRLAPGTYTIAAATVMQGGTQFVPAPASQTVAVTAGDTASRTVTYVDGSIASLAITVAGLPAGANAAITVNGPGSFSTTLLGSGMLYDVAPGTYTISASTVAHDGMSHTPTPATQTVSVAAGEQKAATVTYAVTTGRLALQVTGLPGGTAAGITVTGPGSFSQAVPVTTTLQNLAPGNYVITAVTVTGGGTLYTPSAASQTVAITAGQTASRAVAYTGAGTSLAVTVSGLPGGTSAAALVTGPGGFSQAVTATTTLSGLQPGSYTVAASAVSAGGYTWAGTPASQVVSLTAGQQKTAAVAYAATTGRLTVTVGGLPGGTSAAVTVTGPAGFSQAVSATTTLQNLTPGSYTVAAGTVSAGGVTYTPSSASQAVSVTAGATASRTVTYSGSGGGSGLNLIVDGAYVTQAIQNFAGTVPLVAGREALLRVFVRASESNGTQPAVRVRLYEGANEFRTFTINAPGASVPTTLAEGTLGSSWNATLTASDLRPGLQIVVDVDPNNTLAEPDETDNVWPRTGTAALTVRNVAPFNVVLVPVHQSANGLTGNVTEGNKETFLQMTRRIMPLGEVNASVRATYTTNAAALQSGDENGAWLTVLSEMNALRVADGSSAHYYGVVPTSYSSGIAGYAYVPGRAGVGWDKPGTAGRVAAHEWGHNFSRPHVAACGSGNPDPSYPHPGGVIGHFGWNSGTNAIVSNTLTDIMGYCSTQWISDYTWTSVMNYRGPAPMMAGMMAGEQPVLMVWGRIRNGVVTLEPAFRLVTRPVVAPRPGAYRLELRDESGRVLTGFTFDPDVIDHDQSAQAFAFAVPLSAAAESRLASVAIVGGASGTVEQTARVALARMMGDPAAAPAMITADDGVTVVSDPAAVVRRSGGMRSVTWDEQAWPMAMVRDGATGQVMAYLRKSGDGFVAPAGGVRLVFSNGVRSVTREIVP